MEVHNLPMEETLLPALLKCFGIILLGYILGKFGIMRQKDTKGIALFAQYLALPALIFVRMSTISFQAVKWSFIASVFVSKACVFICVSLMTLLLTHPADLKKAGMYAIATTQSNDFALAYPLFMSLYGSTHPEYADYLYIIAPIQLIVLNTLGVFIMEIGTHKLGDDGSSCQFFKVVMNTVKNPIIFMTIIGMLWNISFGNKISPIFNATLQTLSAAFPATALFLVGHTMAIKGEKSGSHIPITVALLIITKNLILPIILQKCSRFMLRGNNADEIQSWSSFGFLYGTTPTAPTAYVFATQYDTSINVITKTIIGSTLFSAPLMFASASVISISEIGLQNIGFYLSLTIRYLSCASLLCCSWILVSYIIGKKFKNISFGVTLYIFISQFITAVGGLLLFFPVHKYSAIFYAQYILSIGGIYSTRVCTLFLASLLIITRWRSLCYILQLKKHITVISVLCVFFPCCLAAFILLVKDIKSDGPNCQLGHAQTMTTFVVTIICLIGTIICLILQHVCFRKNSSKITTQINGSQPYGPLEDLQSISRETEVTVDFEDEICVDVEDIDKFFGGNSNSNNLNTSDIEGNLCDTRYHCSAEKRMQCATRVTSYKKEEKCGIYDDKEIFLHTSLLIGISVAMTVSLAVSFWKLIMESVNGIFIELEFLDIIINYSLGILSFILFGFNKRVLLKISKRWKLFWHHSKTTMLVNTSSVDICQEFMAKHKNRFKIEIENSKISHCRDYHNLFCSSDLINWLLENGGIKDINEAEVYILNLLEGNVIEKVDKCEFFPEDASIFRLTNT